jgi:hypothetical protein
MWVGGQWKRRWGWIDNHTILSTTLETVILAQARTYNTSPKSFSLKTRSCLLWVPASAGMTVFRLTVPSYEREVPL